MIVPIAPKAPEDAGSPAAAPSKAILELSKSNTTLVSWLVFLAFGGGLLVLHYARIGYLPIVRLDDAISYLFAMSLVGGGFGLLYALLLYFPGAIWSEFLIFDAYLKGKLCYETRDGIEPCLLDITQMLGIPFTFVMVVAHVALLSEHPSGTTLTLESGGGIAVATWYLWWRLRNLGCLDANQEPCTPGLTPATRRALLVKYLVTFVASASISVASLIVIAQVMDPSHREVAILVVCTVIVILTNLLVAVQFRNRRSRATVTAFLAALILLCADEFLTTDVTMSGRILARFGIESEQNTNQDYENSVTVFVNSRGLELLSRLKQAGVAIQLDPSGGHIDGAHILSRLGSEYFLRVEAFRFTVPKEFVSSWLRVDLTSPSRRQRRVVLGSSTAERLARAFDLMGGR